MRVLLLPIFTFCLTFTFFSQDYKNLTIKELESLKAKAVSKENYSEASKIKEIIELKQALEEAVKNENYQLAAEIKQKLEHPSSTQSAENQTSSTSKSEYPFEFYDKIYVVDNGKPTMELEIQNAMQSLPSLLGYGFYKSIIYKYVSSQYSTTQLEKGHRYQLFYKVKPGVDPNTSLKMVQLEASGYETALVRRYVPNEVLASIYKGTRPRDFDNVIPIQFHKVADDVYEITIEELLEPGEYAIMNGDNWHLFGARDIVSIGSKQVEPTEFKPINIYENNYDEPTLAFLGVDYSLCKFTSTKNQGRDDEVRKSWDIGNMKFYKSAVKQGRLENWIAKPENTLFYPEFGRSISAENFPDKWILPDETSYSISLDELEKHIQSYEVNFPGLGMVILPEFFQMKSKELTGYVVIYDFRTRKIVDHYHAEFNLAIDNGFDDDDFEANFLRILKYYIDRKFIPEHEAYLKEQKKKGKG